MDITVTEIMELADMHADSKITEGTPAELLPRNLLQHRMQQICTDVFVLQCQLIEARREVVSLQGQLEAVGAGGVSALVAAPAQPATAKQSPHPEYDKGFSDGWNRCEERQAAAFASQPVAAPAGMEPVTHLIVRSAFRASPDGQDADGNEWLEEAQSPEEPGAFAVFTAAQVQAMLSHGIAPGWQAVPVEPTSEMVIEAYEAQGEATSSTFKEIYRTMLAAAPQPAAQAAADEREETKELRVALNFLAGLHPHLTIDGPPMAVAERIFDAVMGEQAELKARLASYERNMESLRAHLAKHTQQGTDAS